MNISKNSKNHTQGSPNPAKAPGDPRPEKTPSKASALPAGKTPGDPRSENAQGKPLSAKNPGKTPGTTPGKTPGTAPGKAPGKLLAKASAKAPSKSSLPPRGPRLHLWLSFLIPFVGMGLVILISTIVSKSVWPNHQFSILYSDGYFQYFPFFKAFRQTLLSGQSLLHSWNVGLGMDYLSLISYYLASPFYLLSVFVPEGWLMGYFTLLTPLRLGLAGLFFAHFLKGIFHRCDLSSALFASFYALCAWVMGFRWNVMWLDTFMLLPLVALGAVKLLQERKFALYTVTLFLSVFSNYYVGLFTCIFVVLVCLCYEICCWSGFKKLCLDFLWMLGFSVLAIGMTALLELPAFMALKTTESSAKDVISWSDRNIASDSSFLALLDGMRKVAGNLGGGIVPNFKDGKLPNLYCGVGVAYLGFLFLTAPQVKLREKLCTVALLLFFTLSFLFKKLDYLWHGTHVPNMIPYRFSFLYSFVLLYMAYRAWLLRRAFRPWALGVALLPALGVIVANDSFWELLEQLSSGALASQWASIWNDFALTEAKMTQLGEFLEHFFFLAYNLIFLGLYFGALLYGCCRERFPRSGTQKEKRAFFTRRRTRAGFAAALMCLVLGAEQVLNLVNFGVNFFPGTSVSDYPTGTEDTYSMVRLMQQREKELFYRAETTRYQTLNDGALIGYNGITTFTSTANQSVTEYMAALGFYAGPAWNRYVYEQTSPVADLFLNLKYRIDRDGIVEPDAYYTDLHYLGKTHLLQNNYYLPLGFVTDDALGKLKFDNRDDAFGFQDKLLTAATGENTQVWHRVEGANLSLATRDVTLSRQEDNGYCYYKAGAQGGSVYYTYTFDRAGLFCVYLDAPGRNEVTFSHEKAGSDYRTLYSAKVTLPVVYSLCSVEPGDRIQLTVRCTANQKSSLTFHGAVLDEAAFQKAYDTLNQSTWQLTKFTNTRVEGTVDAHRDGLLYTSIPQDGNWQVWVDGEKAEALTVGDAMVAVKLTQGSHTVTMRYVNRWAQLGLGISIVSLAVFLLLCWLRYPNLRKHLQRKKMQKAEGCGMKDALPQPPQPPPGNEK